MLERLGELSIFGGVFGGETRDAAGGFGVVVIEEEGFAVRGGSEEARIGGQEGAVEFCDLHVASNIGTEGPDGVRERGGSKAGMKFFGDGATADEFAALEDQRPEAAFGEVEGGDDRI